MRSQQSVKDVGRVNSQARDGEESTVGLEMNEESTVRLETGEKSTVYLQM